MQREPASSRAIWSLVLGILGLILCWWLSPFAWWLGAAELRDIRDGLSPANGQGLATAGMVLGIIGTVLLAISCCGVLFWVGLIVAGLAFGLS
jgi:4-hydroxybenzoate polyprenyltransferase